VIEMVEAVGYTIERQARRGRWSFDGAIIGTRILIEADGVYWHSSEKVKARDARKDQWALRQGYVLMRVLELDFYKDAVAAIAPILCRAEAEGLVCERVAG
jgi:very-short-patch-repair endonuclease